MTTMTADSGGSSWRRSRSSPELSSGSDAGITERDTFIRPLLILQFTYILCRKVGSVDVI